jgi:hypothetical protein
MLTRATPKSYYSGKMANYLIEYEHCGPDWCQVRFTRQPGVLDAWDEIMDYLRPVVHSADGWTFCQQAKLDALPEKYNGHLTLRLLPKREELRPTRRHTEYMKQLEKAGLR